MRRNPSNLDRLAAERAQAMVETAKKSVDGVKKPVETLERLATRTLGVLQAQGVYAMMLFLFSRSSDEEKVAAKCVRPELFQILKQLPEPRYSDVPADDADAGTVLKFYSDNVLDDLPTLLLIRDLYEQTLIYTRYHAKAAGA